MADNRKIVVAFDRQEFLQLFDTIYQLNRHSWSVEPTDTQKEHLQLIADAFENQLDHTGAVNPGIDPVEWDLQRVSIINSPIRDLDPELAEGIYAGMSDVSDRYWPDICNDHSEEETDVPLTDYLKSLLED